MFNSLENLEDAYETAEAISDWGPVAIFIAIVGGILLYFLFLKSDAKYSEKVEKLRDVLNFKTMLIEPLLKIAYLVLTLFSFLFSFCFISTDFLRFLLFFVVIPIIIRLLYELIQMFIMIWQNTKELNQKIKSPEVKKETKKEIKEK